MPWLTVDGVMQRDIAQQEIGVFGFDEQGNDGVCCDLQIAGWIKQANDGCLILLDVDGVNDRFGVLVAFEVSDLNPIVPGERAVFPTLQFQFG